LSPAGLGVAEIAEAHGKAAEVNGDLAEAVAATPLDAMFEITLGDFAGVTGEDADGVINSEERGNSNDDGGGSEDPGDRAETGCNEGVMRQAQQPEDKPSKEGTAEKQTLGEV
jgi:hypothetical protein